MNVLSLFDGMSCGQLALQKAGIAYDKYFASEVDKYAIKVTQANFPDTIQLGDIRNITADRVGKIDLLIGGSPCQGFSFAGNQLAFDHPQSVLFFEYARLLKELKPKYFLLENVRMKKKFLDVITDILKVEPIFIDSALVSAQSRKRYYWTNIPDVLQPEDQGILLEDIIENGIVDRDKAHCIDANYFRGGNLKCYFEKYRRQLVFNFTYNKCKTISYRKLSPVECERLQTVPDNYTNHVSNTQRYKMLGNGWTVNVIAHIFGGIRK